MKLSKKLVLGCLFLCFALQFGGCNYLSSDNAEKSPNEKSNTKEINIDVAEVKKNEINANIKTLNNEIVELKAKRDNLVRKIYKYEQEIPIGEKDLKKAVNLCQEEAKRKSSDCKEFSNIQANLELKNEKLKQVKVDLGNILQSSPIESTKTPPVQEPDGPDVWTLLLWIAGGIASSIIIAGLGWLIYSFFINASKDRISTQNSFRMAEKNDRELNHKVSELEKTVKLQSGQLTQIQTQIKTLQGQISEIDGQTYKEEEIFTPQVDKPEPQFPVSSEVYLNKVKTNAQPATADLIGGLLINDLNKGNEFLIVSDSELGDGMFYAVPNQARFNTKGEYLNYFQNYYAFETPSSGTIWIITPTIVKRVEGGWRLEEMGELEVR